jgi:excisionase family DNA binding protein
MVQTPSNPDLLTVPEVANKLRLSTRKVYRLIDSGELKAIRLGQRGYRVRLSDLDIFLVEHEVPKEPGDAKKA